MAKSQKYSGFKGLTLKGAKYQDKSPGGNEEFGSKTLYIHLPCFEKKSFFCLEGNEHKLEVQ